MGLVLVACYAALRLANADWWDPLDDLNLAIHEAGHVLFGVFGENVAVLGGSIFQVLVPSLFVGYFAVTRQPFASGIILTWVAVNLLNVSRYVGDATERALPLLGGEDTLHDWWYLLTEWGYLRQDAAIARGIYGTGVLTCVVGLVIALRSRRR